MSDFDVRLRDVSERVRSLREGKREVLAGEQLADAYVFGGVLPSGDGDDDLPVIEMAPEDMVSEGVDEARGLLESASSQDGLCEDAVEVEPQVFAGESSGEAAVAELRSLLGGGIDECAPKRGGGIAGVLKRVFRREEVAKAEEASGSQSKDGDEGDVLSFFGGGCVSEGEEGNVTDQSSEGVPTGSEKRGFAPDQIKKLAIIAVIVAVAGVTGLKKKEGGESKGERKVEDIAAEAKLAGPVTLPPLPFAPRSTAVHQALSSASVAPAPVVAEEVVAPAKEGTTFAEPVKAPVPPAPVARVAKKVTVPTVPTKAELVERERLTKLQEASDRSKSTVQVEQQQAQARPVKPVANRQRTASGKKAEMPIIRILVEEETVHPVVEDFKPRVKESKPLRTKPVKTDGKVGGDGDPLAKWREIYPDATDEQIRQFVKRMGR